MAPTRGLSMRLPESRNDFAARELVVLCPVRRRMKLMKSAHHRSGYGTPTWREVAPTHFRASRPMVKTSSFLSEDGITEATAAVLSVRCVGSAAELSTNRSSFFSPAANAGVHTAAAVAKTRSV